MNKITFLLAYPIMLLWNYALVPALPSLSKINFLQALGIKILIGLLGYSANNKIKN
jgi:hypothetical protein